MIIKTTSLALAATCLMTVSALPPARAQLAAMTELVTNGPQTDPGDVSPSWSAAAKRGRQPTLRSAVADQPEFPRGTDAQGVRSDH